LLILKTKIKIRRLKNKKMAILRSKEISKMSEKDKEEKLKELKLELIKANVAANKTGKIKISEIKRTIAKILTLKAKKPEKQ
jgi:ribosomal protein L29